MAPLPRLVQTDHCPGAGVACNLQRPVRRTRISIRQRGTIRRSTSLARQVCHRERQTCCAIADVKRLCDRRTALLASFGLSVIFAPLPAQSATSVAQEVVKDLYADAIPSPGATWGLLNRTREVIYPGSFAGEWEVAATLSNVKFPLGMEFITRDTAGATKASMIAALPDVGAGMDGAVQYRSRFLPVKGGAVPDRIFNEARLLNAFLGYSAAQAVEYDRERNPQRMAVVYSTPRRDQSQQSTDIRKAELFFNSNRFETAGDEFLLSEAIRQVNQARQSGFVYDYEVIQRFSDVGQDKMDVDMRVAAFIVPEVAGFFKSKGAAVAFYDYKLTYRRVA